MMLISLLFAQSLAEQNISQRLKLHMPFFKYNKPLMEVFRLTFSKRELRINLLM